MSANPYEAHPSPLRLNTSHKDDDPLTVDAGAMDRVDGAQNAASGETFLHTLTAVEENLRVLDETIAELELIWTEDGHGT